ncbi:hypothetical protein CCZ01_05240 [Helicobacter monodelphidis]|uniref:isochorismatase family protein n=1 Tax=Helicobacter sp. 15-1451 TaxID=2004995 RepID=UPI000DCE20E3|nr:isochorismatase family protein [Helicobacter sp. 15-1451]RAX57693.1 hypothetical protein CCZ01_05240 [Helicobacter sp. 15-1451]
MRQIQQAIFEPADSLLICVDVQERLVPVMSEKERVLKNGNILLDAARILSIPTLITEQYTKGLGKSVLNIEGFECFEKLSFSVFGEEQIYNKIIQKSYKKIIFFGIETHVCIFQSIQHARMLDLEVVLIGDACSSRNLNNHHLALWTLSQENVQIIPTESFLFASIRTCKDDAFKAISALVK